MTSTIRTYTMRRAGYTLVELMVVVAIVAVLAAIALPAYNSYVKKAKTTEAVTFLGEIRLAQESYFGEYKEYCNASGDATSWNPDSTPDENYQTWDDGLGNWDHLGVRPAGGKILFSYVTVAGRASVSPSARGFSDDRGYAGTRDWFISSAIADLDGDGTMVTFEDYSLGRGLWISESAGWE